MKVSKQEVSPIFKYSVLSIPATILLIIPNFADPINLPKLLALSVFAFVSVSLFIALKRYTQVKPNYSFEGRTILSLYCLIAIAMALTGVSNNGNYIRALFGTNGRNNGLIYYLSAILLALILLRLVIRELEINYLYRILQYTSIIFGFYCALQFLNLDPIGWSNPYSRVIGTLGNPNFSASALAIFAVFWLYLSFRGSSKGNSQRIFSISMALLLAFLAWSTESLQGLVVIAVGIALIAFMALREKYPSKLIPFLFFLGGGLSLLFLFTSFLGIGPLGSQLEQYTLKLRGYYAYFGLLGMLNSPWNGVGVDNYISAFRTFRTQDFISQYGVTLNSNNAHSTPAQVGATFGVIVFLLYCVLHIWILVKALKILNSRDSSINYLKGIALIWILTLSQSLLSIEIIGLGVMNWLLGAIILGAVSPLSKVEVSAPSKGSESRKSSRALPAWVGSFTIVSFVIASIPTFIISTEEKAFLNIASVRIENNESKDWVKENFNKLGNRTLLESSSVLQILNNLYQAGLGAEVEAILINLNKLNPRDPYPLDMLASYYQDTNQIEKEIDAYKKFLTLDPLNYQLEFYLANAYARKGEIGNLEKSIERIKALAPKSQEYLDAKALLNQVQTTP
jgi:tetratricopeptide (TPR) repeat protein